RPVVMSRVLRTSPTEFWWESPHDPAVELGYVTFTCHAPTADAWDVTFPRYWVEYGGWCAGRTMRLSLDHIAERSLAEQIRAHILARPHGETFRDLWAEVRDLGRAPDEAFRTGVEFWATGGSRIGQKGSIVIRNRDHAAVQWDGEPFTGGTTYPLD